uniref:(northern house mosquito) hypothetical protein n=1 Tax=Culex pipiens TaxID=7175 RepID=A0A8D8BVQ4_CULPI
MSPSTSAVFIGVFPAPVWLWPAWLSIRSWSRPRVVTFTGQLRTVQRQLVVSSRPRLRQKEYFWPWNSSESLPRLFGTNRRGTEYQVWSSGTWFGSSFGTSWKRICG